MSRVKKRARNNAPLSDALHSWWTLDDRIMRLGEDQLAKLISMERDGENRRRMLERIYHRYSRLRREREHKELGL